MAAQAEQYRQAHRKRAATGRVAGFLTGKWKSGAAGTPWCRAEVLK
jgi:DNA invertase Pin-like site-specific DNA recombinase